jgi:hypothetical protein
MVAPNAILCRVWLNNTSLCMTIDAELKRELGLVPKDVIAFRVLTIQGKRVMIGEKVPLHALANMRELPTEALPRGEK